ncbi:tryptophanyl tRNA synthetase [Echinococcus multilocularis]|uniref:tryptophan--tRNA ligase n=1 Tax=Echinococcus multilocularis TaxID=6211 RepID=A0A068YCJ1_ECHMU|nr:tryptophanyl tRNA synthetase [Echinococcus multilocularis]
MLKYLSCRPLRRMLLSGFTQIRAFYVTGHHRQIVVTGIQPTGYPHLGNYFGMIKPCVRLQSEGSVDRFFLLIADLHALTKHTPNNDRAQSTLKLGSALLACGIDPALKFEDSTAKRKTILFPQSSVNGHCELAWILASQCTVNRLAHLPQWREKSEAAGQVGASVGLFTYPLLMAADVLLYAADFVPVGADQITHLELARDLARVTLTHWPSLQGLLKSPCLKLTKTPKVYNLREPTKKMSKSVGPDSGVIWLTDPLDTVQSKVTRAQTDSIRQLTYDPVTRPGVANLMQIFAAAKDVPIQEAVEQLVKLSKVELKNVVTDAIVEELTPIQTRLAELESSGLVQNALSAGARIANLVASQNLRKIKEVMGLHCY